MLARSIERRVPHGPIAIDFVLHSGSAGYIVAISAMSTVGSGIAWQLTADDRVPLMPEEFTQTTGLSYPPRTSGTPKVTIEVYGDQVTLAPAPAS
jgi:hypothetical protein